MSQNLHIGQYKLVRIRSQLKITSEISCFLESEDLFFKRSGMDRVFYFAALAGNQGKSQAVPPGPAGKTPTMSPERGVEYPACCGTAQSSHACNGQGVDPASGASIKQRKGNFTVTHHLGGSQLCSTWYALCNSGCTSFSPAIKQIFHVTRYFILGSYVNVQMTEELQGFGDIRVKSKEMHYHKSMFIVCTVFTEIHLAKSDCSIDLRLKSSHC